MPKTGQTICREEGGQGIDCSGTGRDGDLQKGVAWSNPRFTDNADGTVKDNLTGIIWTKDVNLVGRLEWQQSLDYVIDMNSGIHENFGYTDWRLPNVRELESLLDYGEMYPALPPGHPFINLSDSYGWYWSSTENLYFDAMAVSIHSHVIYFKMRTDIFLVWPVRGGH